MGILVIGSACCMWYFSHGPGQELDSPIIRSYKMVFRYHFGSLAFGSFLLAVVQFLELVLEVFKKQAESSGAASNAMFEYIINCVRCVMKCVERIVEFINKTAYIQIALRGKSFCNAAYDGFSMVWANGIRFMIVGGIGEMIMIIGKLLIAVSSMGAFYCLISFDKSIY